jgi:hypothetical protein
MGTNEREAAKRRETTVSEHAPRAAYAAPRLVSLGSAAAITAAVSMQGLMDGFMGRRTG